MKYLSVCAGIEAATVAWHPLGWEPVGFSEIEKFPSAVLAHHYPDVPNYGDMTNHEQWPETNIDVLVGGTPCQSFSVAGLRQGMADPRGNLALVYLAIAEQYRPRWLVWENVPGVLSSDGGRDFGSIIGGMVELGYCPSWRVLDAQYFGVAQRRRRVFVVASSRDWRDSAEVLFEPASLRRHPAPSRGEGQRVAGTLKACAGNSGTPNGAEEVDRLIPDVVGALSDGAHCGGGLNGQDAYSGRIIPVVGALTAKGPQAMRAPEVDAGHYIAHTLTAEHDASEDGSGRGTPLVVHGTQDPDISEIAHPLGTNCGQENAVAFMENQRAELRLSDVTDSLKTSGGKPGQGYQAVLTAKPGAKQQTYVFKPGQGSKARSDGLSEHVAPTLSSDSGGNAVPAVAFTASDQSNKAGWESDVNPTLNAQVPNDTSNIQYGVRQDMVVRRLTPLECERLQGFPDGYTDIPGASDSARYKALGNSMAVPVMHWIGKRINDYESIL